jgi:hypothetical protein
MDIEQQLDERVNALNVIFKSFILVLKWFVCSSL